MSTWQEKEEKEASHGNGFGAADVCVAVQSETCCLFDSTTDGFEARLPKPLESLVTLPFFISISILQFYLFIYLFIIELLAGSPTADHVAPATDIED